MSEYPKPCKCGSRDLKPRWNSETGMQWVACDECGNRSKPMKGATREELISQWNTENTPEPAKPATKKRRRK